MYNKILIPTDGSVSARKAAEHALDIADKYDASVVALYVVDTSSETRFFSLESLDEVEAGQRVQGERALDEIRDLGAASGLDVATATRRGVPHEAILDFARERGIDLVVMGTHGLTGVDDLVLGSVTEKVVRASEIPIQVVRLSDVRVGTIGDAVDAARGAMVEAGYTDLGVVRTHRSGHTWLVQVVADDEECTVNVDVESGATDIVPFERE